MKRLVKKSWTEIELYHHTSSQLFMSMMEEGFITPGGYSDRISGGGHTQVWDLVNNKNEGGLYKLQLIDIFRQDSDIILTPKLLKYLEDRKKENPDGWKDETVEAFSSNPSGNENGVYLTDDPYDRNSYSYDAISGKSNTSLPNFSVSLRISVQADALSPDYDDLTQFEEEIDPESSKPLWEQSLEIIGQVAHNGPIDVNSITGVKISDSYVSVGNKMVDKEELLNFAEDIIQLDTWLSVEEAYNQLVKLNEEYMNLEVQQLAFKKKRLLKKA